MSSNKLQMSVADAVKISNIFRLSISQGSVAGEVEIFVMHKPLVPYT